MKSKHVLPLQVPSFALLVKRLKLIKDEADVFELWLDLMRVKGDLTVIQKYFNKPFMAKSEDLDMLRRGVKAGMKYVDVPHDLETDADFENLVKNKGCEVIRSFHDFDKTPSEAELLQIIEEMKASGAHYYKLACMVNNDEEADRLLALLDLPKYNGKLVITGMGEAGRRVRIEAPLKGSVFYYAPVNPKHSSAPGQLTQAELEAEWAKR